MPSSAGHEAPSPSASSIFLPLGRRARRDSRSSFSTPVDRDALNEALDTIHSAASQSQVLTVFNEYTEPPAGSSASDVRGIASELQGGLSGFYNKLKASVGAARDAGEIPSRKNVPSAGRADADVEQIENMVASGHVSTVQSPRLQASDSSQTAEVRSQTSRLSAKVSAPTTPALKSPVNPPHKSSNFLADPTVLEVNVHAVRHPTSHGRSGSIIEQASVADTERGSNITQEDGGLSRVSSRTQHDQGWNSRSDWRLGSPLISPQTATSRQAMNNKISHSRGASEQSTRSHDLSGLPVNDNIEVKAESRRLARARSPIQETVSPASPGPSIHNAPLDSFVENPLSRSSTRVELRQRHLSPHPPTSPKGLPVKLRTNISPSRLPGFAASHTSSTDSGVARSNATSTQNYENQNLDGAHDSNRTSEFTKTALSRSRGKLLSREFWMRDDNARDCFHCGEPFSTFRRKHHCRTCGQIFDSKCTVLIDGKQFGSASSVRVCKPCQALIAVQDDDSSDYSVEELALPDAAHRPRTPIADRQLKSPRADDDTASIISQSLVGRTPTMTFPLRRAVDSNNRASAVLEFDTTDRPLPRPSSSRSLKASHSIGHGHKRHHSRHQHMRSFKAYHEDRAPFQRRVVEDVKQDRKQSAFHRDSVIDPDLAQYLSDDASSGDDASIQLEIGNEKLSGSMPENEKTSFGGLLAAVRKGRSRIGERSIASLLNRGRDDDAASIISARTAYHPRPPRKRTLSVSSSVHQRATPRTTNENLHVIIPYVEHGQPASLSPGLPGRVSRMIRSASMRGLGAPSVELNRASLQHVHRLLQQLLRDAKVPHCSSWENALVPILLRATADVAPDVQSGDDMDIRNYVKLKKISGGNPSDTAYVSGLIFTKNLALKSMPRRISRPNILIITFSLEYARYEQHFMSLDPVIRQEREYLANLVGRIAALKPDLLLAEKNVSGLALELLEKANIATAFNVKSTVLDAVSRCTQSKIVHSLDKLAIQTVQLGSCETFEVKTFASEGRRKTYIYLSGCVPQLGCTIAIRGADQRILSKVKRITEFMIYVVYNLKLETCLMRDEWAQVPTAEGVEALKAPLSSDSTSKIEDITTEKAESEPDLSIASRGQGPPESRPSDWSTPGEIGEVSKVDVLPLITRLGSGDGPEIPDDVPVPTFYEDLVEKHQTKILSASPYVKFMPPYLLMRSRELERRVAYLKRLRDQDISEEQSPEEKVKSQKFTLIQPDMVHASLTGAGKKVKEIVHAVHDTEYDKALHNYETQKKQWEAYFSSNKNLFDPYAHQNIVILFSQVSTATSVPCSGPDLLAFNFYSEHETETEFEADCTLGQFVEDLCYRANDVCSSEACEKLQSEHHRQYVHGEAQISVFLHPERPKMRGMHNTILMWGQCRICNAETTVTPMSINTWKYSFGKYLELSFWSADIRARAGGCPHDLHRDHLRYFGYRDFAIRFQYDPIDLLEIIVPRMRITWKVDNDLKFRNEVYVRIEQRLTKFMSSIKYRLKSIKADALLPENADACRIEIDRLTKKANEDHTQLIKQLQERYSNSKHWETIPLNRAIRATLEKVTEWENLFGEFEKSFFPSEKDIRRLATLQLKKIFLDRDVSVTSLTTNEDGTATPPSEETFDEKPALPIDVEQSGRSRKTTILSPEKTQSVLQSVMAEHSSPTIEEDSTSAAASPKVAADISSLPPFPEVSRIPDDVPHLDLAIPVVTGPSRTESTGATIRDSPLTIAVSRGGPDNTASPKETEASGGKTEVPQATDIPSGAQPLHIPIVPPMRRLGNHLNEHDTSSKPTSPTILRAHSQPAGSSLLLREKNNVSSSTVSAINETNGFGAHVLKPAATAPTSEQDVPVKVGEKKLSDRLGLSHLKNSKFVKSHSLIPRAVSNRKESRVSSLAKHFEQLSREFEKERIRERRQRAARNRQSRVYPLAASKPIVEIYKNVDEAVQEKDTSNLLFWEDPQEQELDHDAASTVEGMARTDPSQRAGEAFHTEQVPAEVSETDNDAQETSRATSEVDMESGHSDDDQLSEEIRLPDSPEDLLRLSQDDLDLKELPKHERTSLMKMLTNFWAERSSSGWTALDFPVRPSDHVFADCDIIIREDEPSSIIAFALESQDYKIMLHDIQQHPVESTEEFGTQLALSEDNQTNVLHSLLRKTGSHLKYQFQEGSAKMLCKIFFAEQFDAVRRKCGVSDRIVESLSRCMKWDSKGGKTKSLFLKTLDDRFVLKSLSPIETQSFLKFAPNYFQIMSEAFFHELPSVIAKMLGFYQIIIKNPVTGVEYNWFLLVMENLFYDRTPTRIFDLKGSMRNRKIQSTGERNEVLLDENMVEFIYESPLFTRDHSKKLLKSSVHNDTLFLARQNVMDYSLMVAIDENRKELVVGIIDCIRTYTWDKKLESWIKDRGFAGGNKNRPTVTSPKEYKKRFREAMGRYVLEAPNCWHQFKPANAERRLLPGSGAKEGKDSRDQGEADVELLT